ncbi:hypothetical protein DFJ77DRAFT_287530 [Powellomyces hirtus]|nr:hypothetical protein DFJ77DRAFT_287530 [Powellomyces hirtus]
MVVAQKSRGELDAAPVRPPSTTTQTIAANPPRPDYHPASFSPHHSAGRRLVTAGTSATNLWAYSFRETSRQKSQFCIGCCSVCLVVFAVALLMTVMTITPVIFLSLAEKTSGETDMTMWADWNSGFSLLNYTKAQEVLYDIELFTYNTPRVARYPLQYYIPDSCQGWDPQNPGNTTFTYTGPTTDPSEDAATQAAKETLRQRCQVDPDRCIKNMCSKTMALWFWLIDSDLENEYGIGRAWEYPPVPKDSVYFGSRSARAMGIEVDDLIFLSFDAYMFSTTYNTVKRSAGINDATFYNVMTVNVPLRVAAIYDEDGSNKFPQWTRSQYNAILEYGTILEAIAPFFHPSYPLTFRQLLTTASQNRAQYGEANQIVFACDKPRFKCYLDSNFANVATKLLTWGSIIRFRLGFDIVNVGLDALGSLRSVSTFSQFLSLITSIVVALFVGLSCFLIYNLLMVSVETKTFELGILRMIGQTRGGIVHMILMQAATYSIPAWGIGLALAQIGFVAGKRFLESIANISISPWLTPSSVAVATILGIVVPAIAAILPIRQALSGNLRDALDKRHSKVKPVMITIERSGPGSLASILPNACTGALLAALAFGIYYLVPKALVDNNLALLFNLFMALLLGMLLGMVMLSFNVQPVAEKIILTALLMVVFFENAAIHALVSQNLVAHRLRNRKTATMFAFSLAFIIFLSVNLSVELNGMEFDQMQKIGAQIRVSNENNGNGIPADAIAKIEELCHANRPFVVDWSYSSASMREIDSSVINTQLANLGRIATFDIEVFAVSPNFFNIPEPDSKVYIIGESDSTLSALSVSEQLYTYKGQHSAAISTILRKELAITELSGGESNFTDSFLLQTTVKGADTRSQTQYNVLQPMAFLDSAPYATMTKFPLTGRTGAIVSFPTFVDLSNGRLKSVEEVPITSIHIALDISASEYALRLGEFAEALGELVINTDTSLANLKKEIDDIQSSRQLLSTIFNLATILVMLITLFSLNGCMYTNITEQGKELGVLRALGVTKWGIFRVCTYEAFVLTSAAGLLGGLIGAAIGWSMAAQRAIMTQTPVGFPFPWDITAVAICASVISSFISTTGPVYGLIGKRKIVAILRD